MLLKDGNKDTFDEHENVYVSDDDENDLLCVLREVT